MGWCYPSTSQNSGPLWPSAPMDANNCCQHSVWILGLSEQTLSPETVTLPAAAPSPSSGSCVTEKEGPKGARVSTRMVVESWPQFWAVWICFFHLAWCVSKHVHVLHEGLGSTALLSVPLLFKPANDLDFLVSDLKKWQAIYGFNCLIYVCVISSFPLSALRGAWPNLMALSIVLVI